MSSLIISLLVFAVGLFLLVWLRARTANRFEIKNTDVILALVPMALWLFLTGKITEFAFGEIKISNAFHDAAKAPMKEQVLILPPIDAVSMYEKGGSNEIPRAINAKSQALTFHLGGRGHYVGSVVFQYLDQLTQYPYLRYVVLQNPNDTFFGLADARQIAAILRNNQRAQNSAESSATPMEGEQTMDRSGGGARLTAQNLADWLNANKTEELATLPGFVGAKDALDSKADRDKALQQMNALDVQTLPVVNEGHRFVGVVDRGKLTATILTEVAAKVDRPK